MNMFYKPEFRRKIREKRQQLAEPAISIAAKQVAAQLMVLPQLIDAKNIAYYLPTENELDPRFVAEYETLQNKQFYLPVLEPTSKNLAFYAYKFNEDLFENKYGILEPETEGKTAIACHELDIIFVPLVGFDPHGNRLGRGAGYYDRTFATLDFSAKKRPLLIGLAYEFQKINQIEPDDWDIPMDLIITEKTVYRKK